MPALLETTAHSTTLPQRCRLREPPPRNPIPRNPGPRIQSRPTVRPPLCPIPMSASSLIARKKRKSIRRRSKTGKTLLRPLEKMPLRVRKTTRNTTIARKRAMMWETARKLQKTIVGLGNLYAGDWWWWRDYQDALHSLSSSILGRPRAGNSFAQ